MLAVGMLSESDSFIQASVAVWAMAQDNHRSMIMGHEHGEVALVAIRHMYGSIHL